MKISSQTFITLVIASVVTMALLTLLIDMVESKSTEAMGDVLSLALFYTVTGTPIFWAIALVELAKDVVQANKVKDNEFLRVRTQESLID